MLLFLVSAARIFSTTSAAHFAEAVDDRLALFNSPQCIHDICDCNTNEARQWAINSANPSSSSRHIAEIELVRIGYDERHGRAESFVAILQEISGDLFSQYLELIFDGCSQIEILGAFCDAAIVNNLPATTCFKPDNLSRLIRWLRSANIPEPVSIRLLHKQWLLVDRETTHFFINFFPLGEAAAILSEEFKLRDLSYFNANAFPRKLSTRYELAMEKLRKGKSIKVEYAAVSSWDPINLLPESIARPIVAVPRKSRTELEPENRNRSYDKMDVRSALIQQIWQGPDFCLVQPGFDWTLS